MALKFQIADWTVDPQQCLLVKTSANNRLEPKAMSLLVVLAEAEGELVSRQKLFETVWPDQHVSDYALNTLIANLRKSLDLHPNNASLIETRPKLGYRLSQPVVWLTETDTKAIGKKQRERHSLTRSNSEKSKEQLRKKFIFLDLFKISNYSKMAKRVFFVFLLLCCVFGVEYLMFDFARIYKSASTLDERVISENDVVLRDDNTKVFRYLSQVVLSYSMSKTDENNKVFCSDVTFDALSKIIYKDSQWKIVGQYFTYYLDHKGKNLNNIEETHKIEYQHVYGKEIDIMTVRLDEIGQLTGHADMKVINKKGELICEGKSLFIGSKL